MTDFVPGRDQDASPTIRGFKYQIQVTLLRWLNLGADEILILECGEDVDRIVGAKTATDLQRELEQIKALGRNITLRTAGVLAAFANFAAHLKANPKMSLRFRFTSTALPGRERMSPLGKGLKGIEVWQALQSRQKWNVDDDNLLQQIIRLLSAAKRPEDCEAESWKTFTDLLAGKGVISFAEFLMRFEWGCGFGSPDDLTTVLIERMGGLPGDTGTDDPAREQRYNQLTVALLDILSRGGEKTLTANLLTDTLAKPTLSAHDRARLLLLEEQSESQDAAIASLQMMMQRIQGSGALPILFGEAAALVG